MYSDNVIDQARINMNSQVWFDLFFNTTAYLIEEKNGFVTATKLGATNEFFVASTKILLQQPNVLLIELNILL